MWLVAKTEANRERWAAENIAAQGYKFFLPRFTRSVSITKRLKFQQPTYLFPTYIFVDDRGEGRWYWLLSTFGIRAVITSSDGKPAAMPASAMDELMRRQDADGIIHLPTSHSVQLKPGQAVRVIGGPFAGHGGIWEGSSRKDRERVLINLLGGRTQVFIAREYLQVA